MPRKLSVYELNVCGWLTVFHEIQLPWLLQSRTLSPLLVTPSIPKVILWLAGFLCISNVVSSIQSHSWILLPCYKNNTTHLTAIPTALRGARAWDLGFRSAAYKLLPNPSATCQILHWSNVIKKPRFNALHLHTVQYNYSGNLLLCGSDANMPYTGTGLLWSAHSLHGQQVHILGIYYTVKYTLLNFMIYWLILLSLTHCTISLNSHECRMSCTRSLWTPAWRNVDIVPWKLITSLLLICVFMQSITNCLPVTLCEHACSPW